MKFSQLLCYICIIAIILMIGIPTFLKVKENHLQKKYNTVIYKIKEQAKKCYLDDVCADNKINLQYLIDKEYITDIVNPKTNEYFDSENTIIIKENNNIKIKIVS